MLCINISNKGIEAGIPVQSVVVVKPRSQRIVDQEGNSYLFHDDCRHTEVVIIGEGNNRTVIELASGNLRPNMDNGRMLNVHFGEKSECFERPTNPNTPWYVVRIRTAEPGVRGEGFVKVLEGKVNLIAKAAITDEANEVILEMRDTARIEFRIAGSREIQEFCPAEFAQVLFAPASQSTTGTTDEREPDQPLLQ